MTTPAQEPVLLISDSWGIYIPQMFAQSLGTFRGEWQGLEEQNVNVLLAGPDNEHYWFAWDDILSAAEFKSDSGSIWYLNQDMDLWLVPKGYEFPDQ